eukprot:TRINITY_DN3684_c2_g1_i1.p1 TRINITY_DN3684_c2_g1~~TRINITY_DN3684_c2_g1_i1.p1  ORF type:complete len:634 (+),score=114.77 TRINITY_DN3684_c2_g1_i1:168-1904(+)
MAEVLRTRADTDGRISRERRSRARRRASTACESGDGERVSSKMSACSDEHPAMAAEGAASVAKTRPPLRLRMASQDILCARSMEVDWDEGAGVRHQWSSWSDQVANGWHEAEKLLPSSATDIRVRFQARGLRGFEPVWKVDRRRRCAWVLHQGQFQQEVITLRARADDIDEGVDVLFELKGPATACYVSRAWNAKREIGLKPSEWEHWEEVKTRPRAHAPPATLEAADGAAPLLAAFGDPELFFACATKRLGAAATALVEVHRATLRGLWELEGSLAGQKTGVNAGNTATAGLGIASAVLLFVAPPLGVALGAASATAGGVTCAGDALADQAHAADLREQLSRDAWDSFAFAELLQQWLRARKALGTSVPVGAASAVADGRPAGPRRPSDGDGALSAAIDAGLMAGAVTNTAATTATRLVAGLSAAAQSGALAATGVLGIVGALISTGMAIRGFKATKPSEQATRDFIAELRERVLQTQHLLAVLGRLECPICCDTLTLEDDVKRCSRSLHYFHTHCALGPGSGLDPHVVRGARAAGIPLGDLVGVGRDGKLLVPPCKVCKCIMEPQAKPLVAWMSRA